MTFIGNGMEELLRKVTGIAADEFGATKGCTCEGCERRRVRHRMQEHEEEIRREGGVQVSKDFDLTSQETADLTVQMIREHAHIFPLGRSLTLTLAAPGVPVPIDVEIGAETAAQLLSGEMTEEVFKEALTDRLEQIRSQAREMFQRNKLPNPESVGRWGGGPVQ